jgi:ribosome maturation factor RimP
MPDAFAELTERVRERIDALGYELVDLQRGGTKQRTRLQLRIDRPDAAVGRGITVGECAEVSRALEEWLDATSLLGTRYVLEVSSPGIERPIRWREHWIRFAGREVNLTIRERGRVRATILRVEGDDIVLQPMDGGDEVAIPLNAVKNARLAVDWDTLGTPHK